MNSHLIRAAVFLIASLSLSAHFVFVVPQAGGSSAQVIMSEDLKPTAEVDISMIRALRLNLRDAQGQNSPLTITPAEHAYTVALPGSGTRVISGFIDLGVMQHGSKANVLLYYPKTIVGNAFDAGTRVGESAVVEIVPSGKPGSVRLQVLGRGKPVPASEVTVILPDGTQTKMKTDQEGFTGELTQTGRYGAWARFWEATPGDRDGKHYEELRHYATIVFDADSMNDATASSAQAFAKLPQAASSLGAAAADGWLYVYGGHIAPTHNYSTEAVTGKFERLNLKAAPAWESLPSGPAVQGMNIAAYQGKIYRVGGMEPRNAPGTKADNHSIATCARFDPAKKAWEDLPALPEARSSHDVVFIGSKMIVTGGWNMKGSDGDAWAGTVQILDLASSQPAWVSAPQPFHRRALIAAAFANKMYVMGGITETSEITREVSIYDPVSNTWSKGPEIPGDEINAFAPAACVHQNHLYLSVADGSLYRLDDAGQSWVKAGSGSPRLAHRIASSGDAILVIGGATKGKNVDLIERIVPTAANTAIASSK